MAQFDRIAAKVLLVTPQRDVLLFGAVDESDSKRTSHWFPVGGGVEDGESLTSAALREVCEETGLSLLEVGEPVMFRHASFDFEGDHYEQDETYFLVVVERFEPSRDGWTEVERRAISKHRWWSLTELRTTNETIFPEDLVGLLDDLPSIANESN